MDAIAWWRDALAFDRPAPPTREAQRAALRAAWDLAGRAFFNGTLPARQIDVRRLPPRLRAEVTPEAVAIAAAVVRDWRGALAALLNAAVRVMAPDPQHRGYGRLFCDGANRVGAMIGARVVAPKGIGGERAERWPDVPRCTRGDQSAAESALLAEIDTLRGQVEAARMSESVLLSELDELRTRWASAKGADVAICGVVCGAVRRANARVKRLRVRSGGQAATARAVSRELEALRARLAALPLLPTARAVLSQSRPDCVPFAGMSGDA